MSRKLCALACASLMVAATTIPTYGEELLSSNFYESLQADFSPLAVDQEDETSAEAEQVSFAQIAYGKPKAAAKKKAGPPPGAKSHKGVFYANDFSYINDPKFKGHYLGDSFKQQPVAGGDWGTLDVGGQIRFRWHGEANLGREDVLEERFQNNFTDFLLTRVRLFANWQINDRLRVYAEGIHADVVDGGGEFIPRPIDINRGDFLNLFVDLKLTDSLVARVGRQELLYGSQRVVSPLDWGNTRRTFEGARLLYKNGNWTNDTFWTAFVPVAPEDFDEANYNIRFYGNYATYQGFQNFGLDAYYLGFDSEPGDFSIHTLGLRLNGGIDNWLFEFEGGPQFGRQSGQALDHGAGFATAGIGRKFNKPGSPTLWFYYDYASGGPVNDGTGSFNQYNELFPLAHKYLGFIDNLQRTNIESPNVLLTVKPGPKWNLLFWYYHFISNDAAGANPAVAGNTATQSPASTDLGDELDVLLKYTICPRSNMVIGWSHYWAGNRFVNAVDDADFVYGQYTVNF